MENNDYSVEPRFGYYAKNVAVDLEVTTSTLRRWSIALEKEGYKFERNENEHRIYYERDFKAFRELKRLLSHSVSFEDAVKAVAAINIDDTNANKTYSVKTDEIRLSKSELEGIIQETVSKAIQEHQETMFEALEMKLDNIIERRDRYLTMGLQQSLEEKRLAIAATAEEEKKPWWKRIFS